MTERGEALRLAFEPHSTLRIGGDVLGQDLDRDGAIQFGIAGAIHFAHAAAPDERLDFICTETATCRQCHGCFRDAVGRIVSRMMRSYGLVSGCLPTPFVAH